MKPDKRPKRGDYVVATEKDGAEWMGRCVLGRTKDDRALLLREHTELSAEAKAKPRELRSITDLVTQSEYLLVPIARVRVVPRAWVDDDAGSTGLVSPGWARKVAQAFKTGKTLEDLQREAEAAYAKRERRRTDEAPA